jgi:hypothetical protein
MEFTVVLEDKYLFPFVLERLYLVVDIQRHLDRDLGVPILVLDSKHFTSNTITCAAWYVLRKWPRGIGRDVREGRGRTNSQPSVALLCRRDSHRELLAAAKGETSYSRTLRLCTHTALDRIEKVQALSKLYLAPWSGFGRRSPPSRCCCAPIESRSMLSLSLLIVLALEGALVRNACAIDRYLC